MDERENASLCQVSAHETATYCLRLCPLLIGYLDERVRVSWQVGYDVVVVLVVVVMAVANL